MKLRKGKQSFLCTTCCLDISSYYYIYVVISSRGFHHAYSKCLLSYGTHMKKLMVVGWRARKSTYWLELDNVFILLGASRLAPVFLSVCLSDCVYLSHFMVQSLCNQLLLQSSVDLFLGVATMCLRCLVTLKIG